MATKKKLRKSPIQGRILTAVLSLGLLAAAGMAGMYTVGRNEPQEQKKQNLAEKIEETEKAFDTAEAEPKEEKEEESKPAASSSARASFRVEPELESDFADLGGLLDENAEMEELLDTASDAVLNFSPENEKLLWPIAGDVILDYSMDRTVYFETLEQYKYNPAIIIRGEVNQDVLCGADGIVESIAENDETGLTVTVDFGNGYQGIYGQLKELAVEEGRQVKAGDKLGCLSEPTYYFAREGANVYLKILKDGKPVDPLDVLQ